MRQTPPVLLFGLGAMGLPIARRLLAAGFAVWGVDPRADALAALHSAGGRAAPGAAPAQALAAVRGAHADCDVTLISCLPDDQVLTQLWCNAGGLSQAPLAGCTVIDHTTCGIALAQQLAAQCATQQAHWVDAPVSGGIAGAQAGSLSAMLGGTHAAVQQAQAVLSAYCASAQHLGPAGAGQAGKLANQLAIAGTNLGLMAATRFASAQGLDVAACLAALAGGSAHSVQMEQHRAALARYADDPLALFDWLPKDLALAQAQARQLPSDVQALVDRITGAFAP